MTMPQVTIYSVVQNSVHWEQQVSACFEVLPRVGEYICTESKRYKIIDIVHVSKKEELEEDDSCEHKVYNPEKGVNIYCMELSLSRFELLQELLKKTTLLF